ncbi:MAG: tripartite tricarboxylate transporter TctB family protein [Candidatus Rokubacteria bacterium]|nr:tripartite tricarboxylate transporter TctB family protein [Candidatus Rokubacteria bacterium]
MRQLPLATALAFLAGSILFLVQAARIPLGSTEQPGPGLFPVLVGAFLLAVGVAFLLQCLREGRAAVALPAAGARRRVGVVGVALSAFCLLLPWVGYTVTALGLVIVLLRVFGMARWTLTAAVAIVATAASYYLFAVILGVPLPAGLWSHR